MFYVYVYYHPVTNVPFYVGKGKENRDLYHLHNKRNHYNKDMRSILQELDNISQQPIITRVLEGVDEQTAYDEEQRLIQLYGRMDLGTGSLCNKTMGGEGFGRAGRKWSEEERKKHQQTRQLKPQGVGYTQYDMIGQKLNDYTNAAELRNTGFSKTQIMAIRRCCRGQRFSAEGFRWSYINQPLQKVSTTHKEVIQYDKHGNYIAKYASVGQASISTGINAGDIASVARGNTRMKSAGGYVWRYTD